MINLTPEIITNNSVLNACDKTMHFEILQGLVIWYNRYDLCLVSHNQRILPCMSIVRVRKLYLKSS